MARPRREFPIHCAVDITVAVVLRFVIMESCAAAQEK